MKYCIASLFALVLISTSCSTQTKQVVLKPADFQASFEKTGGILLDVRTPEEFAEFRLAGAVNMDYNAAGFANEVASLDKTKPVYVYCLAGGRSTSAAKLLKEKGFQQIYELEGGLLAWNNAKLPVVQEEKTVASTAFTVEAFEKAVADSVPVLVDFNAVWCGPCKKLDPILTEIGNENAGKLKILRIDVDENFELAEHFNITAIPLLYLYKDGKKVWEQKGLCDKQTIVNQLQ